MQRILFLVLFLPAAFLFCSCDRTPKSAAPPAPESAAQTALRNNCASLLYDLLGDEAGVSKLLIIKHDRKELHGLIEAISTMAADEAGKLEKMARKNPSLNLKKMDMPAGEKATRSAIAKTKGGELLFSSGKDFEFNLLLSQAEALSYGQHLAQVADENSLQPDEAGEFLALSTAMQDLHERVVALMRSPPAK